MKEICLTNGARIILKCTKDGERQITLTAFAKGGASVLPPEKYSQLEGVAGYMEMGGIEKMDYDEILRATHTMKGIASNLEFTQLQQKSAKAVDMIRQWLPLIKQRSCVDWFMRSVFILKNDMTILKR